MCLINAYQKIYVFWYSILVFNMDATHNSATYYLRSISQSQKKIPENFVGTFESQI